MFFKMLSGRSRESFWSWVKRNKQLELYLTFFCRSLPASAQKSTGRREAFFRRLRLRMSQRFVLRSCLTIMASVASTARIRPAP